MTLDHEHSGYLPDSVSNLDNPQTDIPRIAKDRRLVKHIEAALQQIPTQHRLFQADSRRLDRDCHAEMHPLTPLFTAPITSLISTIPFRF